MLPAVVTVIVAGRDIAALAPAALDSLLAQTEPRFRAILIDDGSVDETGAIFRHYADTDARFQAGLLEKAKAAKKLRADFSPEPEWSHNTPQRLRDTLAPFRKDGTLPDYPLGSDFTAVEQRLAKALGWLKRETATLPGKLKVVSKALATRTEADLEALQRMGLDKPRGMAEWVEARLVRYALHAAR